MKSLWKAKGGRTLLILVLLFVFLFCFPFPAFLMMLTGAPWSDGLIIFSILLLFYVGFLLYLGQIVYEVTLDEGGQLAFRRLLGTMQMLPAEMTEIRIDTGVLGGAIVIRSIRGTVRFTGNPRFRPVMKRMLQGNWDESTRLGISYGHLPSDETLWDLFITLQTLQPNLRIASPYIQEQMELRWGQ